jgi:hypothetical protein
MMNRSAAAINIAVVVFAAGFALFTEPITVARAGPVPPTPVTCTLAGSYTIDTTGPTDVLTPFVTASGDCAAANCTFLFSSRVGDIGDWFAICQGSTDCHAYTTISVDATVDSFPLTDEPEVISYCSTNPIGDSGCFTGSPTKGCNAVKEVDCFAGVDVSCSASKHLGGGIKGTFVCILNLPEPGLPAPGVATVLVTADCKMS